jgi:Flp pilus assembly pilin Flp
MFKRTLMPKRTLGRKGQMILEYTVILVVILGVLIAMKDYIKRGVQGRWKSATDDFGEQYDPQYINSNIVYSTQVNGASMIYVTNGQNEGQQGMWTNRVDTSNVAETKTGYSQVGY